MKILQVHNDYIVPGGETRVVELEKQLLESYGHTVFTYYKSSSEIEGYSLFDKLRSLFNLFFSYKVYKDVKERIENDAPDVIHIHNVFPLISPSVYYIAKRKRIKIVETLHNFRFLCINGLFFRDGGVCERCPKQSFLHGIKNKCQRNSLFISLLYSLNNYAHRLRVFKNGIDAYICLSQFSRNKYIEYGFDESKIFVKPNFYNQENCDESPVSKNKTILFLGRLEKEKGIELFINLAVRLPQLKFVVAGTGSYEERIRSLQLDNLEYKGFVNGKDKDLLISEATMLVFPSNVYENFPMVVLEAMKNKTCVCLPKFGSMEEMIEDKKTGFLYRDENELVHLLETYHDQKKMLSKIESNAYNEFMDKYSSEKNYQMLMQIYTQ